MKRLPVKDIKLNPDNPRKVSKKSLEKLVNSIKKFEQMLDARPLIVDKNHVVVGGNQRLLACREIGLETVPVIIAENWSDDQLKEVMIKDNITLGEWDWDALANNWEYDFVKEVGLGGSIFDPKVEPKASKVTVTSQQILSKKEQEEQKFQPKQDTFFEVECKCCGEKIMFKY